MQISIASGKGGTGKTTLAVNLAAAGAARLSKDRLDGNVPDKSRSYEGKGSVRLHILDCDVEEPNCHIFLRPSLSHRQAVSIPVPDVDETRCVNCGLCAEACAFHAILSAKKVLVFPELCHGCGACGYVCPEKCIVEIPRAIGFLESGISLAGGPPARFAHGILNTGEALAAPIVKRVRQEAKPGSIVIVDSPPGTSCTMMASVKDTDLCVLVTEPTPFGLHDLELAYEAATKLRVPCAVVINRSDIGDSRVSDFCRNKGLPVLAEIPLDRELARISAEGGIAAVSSPEYFALFSGIFDKASAFAAEHSSGKKARAEHGPAKPASDGGIVS